MRQVSGAKVPMQCPYRGSFRLVIVEGILWVVSLLAVVWMAGALYFDVAQRAGWGRALALVWVAAAGALLTLKHPVWQGEVILLVMVFGFLLWWFSQKPSHDRDWEPNFSRLPRIDCDHDTLTVTDLRNTEYLSPGRYEPRWEARSYSWANLQAADILILYWGSSLMCHPLAVFDFGEDGQLCFSIEVRYRRGEPYSTVRNLYRQNEIMMVVSDERDSILMRTKFSDVNEVYMYRMQKGTEFVRELLDTYVRATNDLYETPRWYNLITWNCTTSIYWLRRGQISWDWRLLFNGSLDKMLYDWGRLYQGLPFEELKAQSLINDRANAAARETFGRDIRAGLPGFGESKETDS